MNFLTDLDGFLERWAAPVIHDDAACTKRRAPRGAFVYSPQHPRFEASLEPGVRDLVLALVDKESCVTYSSCEGHRARAGQAMQLLHVGIIARTDSEHTRLHASLRSLARRANRMIKTSDGRASGVKACIHIECLQSEAGSRPCLDLVIEQTATEARYFADLPRLTKALTSVLCERTAGMAPTDAIAPEPGSPSSGALSRYPCMARFCMLSNTQRNTRLWREAKPYPHMRLAGFMSPLQAREIEEALDAEDWQPVQQSAYQFEALDLLRFARRQASVKNLVRSLASEQWLRAIAEVTGLPGVMLDAVHGHRMTSDQSVGVHSDGEGHPSAVRLVLYLDTRMPRQGGIHLLLRERAHDFVVQERVVPRAGDALLFPMGGKAFHAVTEIRGRKPRHTIVATFSAPTHDDGQG